MSRRNLFTSSPVTPLTSSIHLVLTVGVRSSNLSTAVRECEGYPNPKSTTSLRLIDLLVAMPKNEDRRLSPDGERRRLLRRTEFTAASILGSPARRMKRSPGNLTFDPTRICRPRKRRPTRQAPKLGEKKDPPTVAANFYLGTDAGPVNLVIEHRSPATFSILDELRGSIVAQTQTASMGSLLLGKTAPKPFRCQILELVGHRVLLF